MFAKTLPVDGRTNPATIKSGRHLFLRTLIFLTFLSGAKLITAQSSGLDTLKGKRAWTLGVGNSVKGGLGTTFVSFGYNPNRYVDFYVAPSWGIFTGGTAIFFGSKINFFSKNKFFVNSDITFRHSSRTVVSYENHSSGGQESYYIPPSDYLLAGLGINYRRTERENLTDLLLFNVTLNYNFALGKHNFVYRTGPFSKDGEDAAKRKLTGGWGVTVSFAVQIWQNKRKK